jgi:hypothetical protein
VKRFSLLFRNSDELSCPLRTRRELPSICGDY